MTPLVFEDGRLKKKKKRKQEKRGGGGGVEGREKNERGKKASEKLFNYKHGLPSPFQLHNRA